MVRKPLHRRPDNTTPQQAPEEEAEAERKESELLTARYRIYGEMVQNLMTNRMQPKK